MRPELTSTDLPPETDWRAYVPAPREPDARPVGVLLSEGRVLGVDEFLRGDGELVLEHHGDAAPSVVLDYGTNVAGRPWFQVADVEGSASVRISYSESAHWAGPDGDERGGHNASSNPSRVQQLTVDAPGIFNDPLIQGGQRFQRIALETTGRISLSGAGICFTAYRATPDDYEGWFICNSDLLTRLWYESAYTTQLNQLPADSLPIAWTIDEGHLSIDGGTLGVLKAGLHWSDVAITFETKVVDNAAGWVVRAQDDGASGYLLQLRAPQNIHENASLRWGYFDDRYEHRPQDTVRRYTTLRDIDLGAGFDAFDWHQVRTVARGSQIIVDIDGTVVARIDLAAAGDTPVNLTGSVGFHEAWYTSKVPGERAFFRNLRVTDEAGALFFEHPLDDVSVLEQFVGDGLDSPDPLPVILDGARRDRSVWSGDLIVQVPNVYYSTAASDYVTGSIELLNSFREADGRLPARLPPLFAPATAPQHGQVYSAVYSMHQITNVALHYRFTGDVDFVRAQWPAILGQLKHDLSRVDDRGLYLTDEEDGLDWDWYDGPKTGAVSAYNIVYHQVLKHASELASAIGELTLSEELAVRAEQSRTAVNTYLYDPARHLYVLSESRRDAIAQDANALAVVNGVAPVEEIRAILDALDDALPQTPFGPQPFNASAGFQENVSPYTSGFHLNALFEAAQTERALALLENLWGHMAEPGPYAAGTVWELLNTDGTPGFGVRTSLAHGWACAPSVALSSYVLGVTPTDAAFRTWSVAPQTGPLTWARGRVPTPHGPIDVSWHRTHSSLTLELTVPEGTSGSVVLPVSSGAPASLAGETTSGEKVNFSRRSDVESPTVSFHITAGGRYTLKV